jgi:hypothetical protein
MSSDRREGSEYAYCENLGTNAYTRLSCGPWLFCWNVKARSVNFDFEHLLKRYQQVTGGTLPRDPRWSDEARKVYDGVSGDTLWEWGVEGARRPFVDDDRGAQGRPEDGQSILWDGTPVTARFMFGGRSGGWLILTRFNRQTLDEKNCGYHHTEPRFIKGLHKDTSLYFKDWSYRDLCRLYRYAVMIAADLKRIPAATRIEECASFDFVVNACGHLENKFDIEDSRQEAQNWP